MSSSSSSSSLLTFAQILEDAGRRDDDSVLNGVGVDVGVDVDVVHTKKSSSYVQHEETQTQQRRDISDNIESWKESIAWISGTSSTSTSSGHGILKVNGGGSSLNSKEDQRGNKPHSEVELQSRSESNPKSSWLEMAKYSKLLTSNDSNQRERMTLTSSSDTSKPERSTSTTTSTATATVAQRRNLALEVEEEEGSESGEVNPLKLVETLKMLKEVRRAAFATKLASLVKQYHTMWNVARLYQSYRTSSERREDQHRLEESQQEKKAEDTRESVEGNLLFHLSFDGINFAKLLQNMEAVLQKIAEITKTPIAVLTSNCNIVDAHKPHEQQQQQSAGIAMQRARKEEAEAEEWAQLVRKCKSKEELIAFLSTEYRSSCLKFPLTYQYFGEEGEGKTQANLNLLHSTTEPNLKSESKSESKSKLKSKVTSKASTSLRTTNHQDERDIERDAIQINNGPILSGAAAKYEGIINELERHALQCVRDADEVRFAYLSSSPSAGNPRTSYSAPAAGPNQYNPDTTDPTDTTNSTEDTTGTVVEGADLGYLLTSYEKALTRNFARALINAINRTTSGGDAYDVIANKLQNPEVCLVTPDSKEAGPLQVWMKTGVFHRPNASLSQPNQLDAIKQHYPDVDYGIIAYVTANSHYRFTDVNPLDEHTPHFARIAARFHRFLALSLPPSSSSSSLAHEILHNEHEMERAVTTNDRESYAAVPLTITSSTVGTSAEADTHTDTETEAETLSNAWVEMDVSLID